MTTDIVIPAQRGPAAIGQATAVEQSRAVAEVQAAVFVAQQFPRDIARAEAEMHDACNRLALASRAFYRVTNRGNGPSVHLARELARIWGNIDYGVRELRRDDAAGESEIQAFAWDQQTNTRSTRTFVVPHQRMKGGKRQDLTDLGDVYLNNQNIGARAVRECIFTVLPTSFTETAQEVCHLTIERGDGKPLSQRIEEMVAAFDRTHGVKAARIEEKLGRKRGQWDAGDVATMGIVFGSLARGETTVDDEFPSERPSAADFLPPQSPAEPAAAVTPEPGATLSPRTRGRMFGLFNDAGMADEKSDKGRQVRLDYIAQVIGRQVTSSNDLSPNEASAVIQMLEKDIRDQEARP